MMHGTYVGLVKSLEGKTATLLTNKLNLCEYLAQFDDVSTGLGHGWHRFPDSDFVLDDPEVN